MLCAAGCPAGLVIGYLVGRVLMPVIMASTSLGASCTDVSMSPVIFIAAALFSIVTVFISCSRPTRMASKVSPVEAVKYTEASSVSPKKVRRIYHDSVVTGFAGTVADAFSLLERFEAKLEKYSGSLKRAAVSLAQEWRTDKVMRQLNAMLIVADKEELLIVSGTGEVIDPDDGIAAIGSGGMFALSAAKALKENTDLSAAEIATKAIKIASDICIYTNSNITMEEV